MTKKPIRHAIQDNTYNPTYKSEFIEVFDGYEWVLQEVRREILPSDEVDDQEETRGTQPVTEQDIKDEFGEQESE